jgi:ADP-ribose pyrophosphatase
MGTAMDNSTVNRRVQTYLQELEQLQEPVGDPDAGEIGIVADRSQLLQRFVDDDFLGLLYRDQYITLLRDPVVFPSREAGSYLRILHTAAHRGKTGAALLGVSNGQVLMVHVYRHALRNWEWSIPRGFSEPGEDGLSTGLRELREETGFEAQQVQSLGWFTPDSGLLAERVELIYALLGHRDPSPTANVHEVHDIALVPAGELEHRIGSGEIQDSFTIVAFARAAYQGLLKLQPS